MPLTSRFLLAVASLFVVTASAARAQCFYPPKQALTPSISEAGAAFGTSVDMDGDVIVVGARTEDANGLADSGAAYVFERSGATWTESARLTAGDAAAGDWFGAAVAVSSDRIAVGAPLASVSGFSSAGAVYVFEKVGSTWTSSAKLNAGNLAASSLFGRNIAMEGGHLVVARLGHVAVLEHLLGSWFQTFETPSSSPTAVEDIDVAAGRFIMSFGSGFGSQLFEKVGSTWLFAGYFGGTGSSSNQPKVAISDHWFIVSGSQAGKLFSLPAKIATSTLSSTNYTTFAIADDTATSGSGSVFALEASAEIMSLQAPEATLSMSGEWAVLGNASVQEARVYLVRDPFISIGAGCPGEGGFAPELDLGSCSLIGGPVTLKVSGGPGGSIALVHLGLDEADIPIGAGCSLFMSPVLPTAIFLPLFGAGAGNGQVQVTVTIPPAAVPSSFLVQSFVQDPTTTIGFTSTNGVRMTIQ